MIRASFEDVVIEKQRQALIPGFADVRRDALGAGALGCSISGAGPALFAWAQAAHADAVLAAMRAPFEGRSIGVDAWVVEIDSPGARVVA
jgi:homoserine kinase